MCEMIIEHSCHTYLPSIFRDLDRVLGAGVVVVKKASKKPALMELTSTVGVRF